jgi:hypothetical protein
MTKLTAGLGAIGFIIGVAIGAVAGILGSATTALIVAGGAYFIGFVTMGTAQAISIWMVAGGALLGGVAGALQALLLASAS